MNEYDVVIIGGGAAGLSAALVLARAGRGVLVVDSGAPRNSQATHTHGFLSRDGMSPGDLLTVGRDEVRGYGGEILSGSVTALSLDEAALDEAASPAEAAGFRMLLADGSRVAARRLLLATGLRDELPEIPGLRDRWARDVLHCPYCHGYEVRGLSLGVIGGSPNAVGYAQIVRQWSHDVVLFTRGAQLGTDQRSELDARGVGVVDGPVARVLVEQDRLCGVEMADGRVVPREAVFVPPRFVPNDDLLVGLGCEVDADGWPVRDASGRTSVRGVWVAGNVANPRAQLVTAAGEGSAAAIAINADLVDEDVRRAVRDFAGGTA
jgi:thioredoxin reductase